MLTVDLTALPRDLRHVAKARVLRSLRRAGIDRPWSPWSRKVRIKVYR